MKLLVVWLIAFSTPTSVDYAFYTTMFNNEADCNIEIATAEIKSPLEVKCVPVGVWAPIKPTDV